MGFGATTKLHHVVSERRDLRSVRVAKCAHKESGLVCEFNQGQPD